MTETDDKFVLCFIFSGCGNNVVFDVGFAIDGSNSIDSNEYRLTKDFVEDIIGIFSISEQATHIGLLEYGSEASIKIYFDEYSEAAELLESLTQIQSGSTNIGRGLEKALDMFSAQNGMRDKVKFPLWREGACKLDADFALTCT